jgi:peroxin-10
MRVFPAAGACAELLLAYQKDQFYQDQVRALLSELAERLVGSHLLTQILPEISSFASILYFTLTLRPWSRPQQTLGEEYCDVMRVTSFKKSKYGKSVSVLRHLIWVLLQIVPRYVILRSRLGWSNLCRLTRTPRERMQLQMRQRQQQIEQERQRRIQNPSVDVVSDVIPKDPPMKRMMKVLDTLVTHVRNLGAWFEQDAFPEGYEFSWIIVQNILRDIQLASFYLYSKYYLVSNRLTKIQYQFVHAQQKPSVHLGLLGHLIYIRLVVHGLVELRKIWQCRQHAQRKKHLVSNGPNDVANNHPYTGTLARVPTLKVSDDTNVSSNTKRKCALCLEELVFPSATPCGHVFCWQCIVGWCQKNKTECPLCRQATHPQQIKCIYNY